MRLLCRERRRLRFGGQERLGGLIVGRRCRYRELRLRNDRIRRLEADLAAARRSPAMVADVLAHAETAARAKLADLRTALTADLPAMREVFQSLFPEGPDLPPRHQRLATGLGDLRDRPARQSQIE